jgi:hypothetical protein
MIGLLLLSSSVTISLSIAGIAIATNYVRCAASVPIQEGVDRDKQTDDTVVDYVLWQQTQDHLQLSQEEAADIRIT